MIMVEKQENHMIYFGAQRPIINEGFINRQHRKTYRLNKLPGMIDATLKLCTNH